MSACWKASCCTSCRPSPPPDETRKAVTLHIATNADSLATWFLTAIANFSKDAPYLLNVAIDDEDHTAEWLQRGPRSGSGHQP